MGKIRNWLRENGGEYKVVGYWDLGEEKVYEFGVHGKWSVVGFIGIGTCVVTSVRSIVVLF